MSFKEYQVRYDGPLNWFDTFEEALTFAMGIGTWEKISWTVAGGRFIIYGDGTWEYRDADMFERLLEKTK